MLVKKGLVTFTFDDGISKNFELALDNLEKENIKATFFLIGGTINKNNEYIIKLAHDKGHTIGNHTWSHCNLVKTKEDAYKKEIHDTENKLKSIINTPIKYFRPPYGSINPSVRGTLIDMGYTVVLWNVDANDWNLKVSKQNMLKYYTDTFSKADPSKQSYIILQHDRRTDSVNLIPDIAGIVRDKGFKIVPLDEYMTP